MTAAPAFLFAHGAGAPSSTPWMRAWRDRLATLGEVTAFDYPYMRAGRKTPDRMPVLLAAHREALADLRARLPGRPVFLVGKSMGGRVGCHVTVEMGTLTGSPTPPAMSSGGRSPPPLDAIVDGESVAGLICLGYPLVAAQGGGVRDEVLLALRTPILFVQGSRDSLCPITRLEEVRARMQARNVLHIVEGANHSLELPSPKRNAAAQKDAEEAALGAIRRFVQGVIE